MLIHFSGEMTNSLINLAREKKVGVAHEKRGIWPPKPSFSEVMGVKCALLFLEYWFFFSREMTNLITIRVKKKVVSLIKKWAYDPKNPFFYPQHPFLFWEESKQRKKMGVTHVKWVFDPKNPILVRFLRSNAHNFA